MNLIPKDEVLKMFDDLMKSPWFLDGKDSQNPLSQSLYWGRKEALGMLRPYIEAIQPPKMDTPFCPYCGHKREGLDAR